MTKLPITDIITSIFLSFISLCIGIIIWSMFKPADLSYQNLPWEIVAKGPIKAGDIVPMKVVRCNNTEKTVIYELTRGFKNIDTGIVITAGESTKVAIAPGCQSSISLLHRLPNEIKPGRYVIIGAASVPDSFGDKIVDFSSQPFTVE